MPRCSMCGKGTPVLTADTNLCPECAGKYTVYSCSTCGTNCLYRNEALPDLPNVQVGLCGFCYRRSLAASLTDVQRAAIRGHWQKGDRFGALGEVTRLLDLSPMEALAVAYEVSQSAEPGVAPDRRPASS
jgi:hypothetical protein